SRLSLASSVGRDDAGGGGPAICCCLAAEVHGPPVRRASILVGLARIGAPDLRLAEPAPVAVELHLAPLAVAGADGADDAGLKPGDDARGGVGSGAQQELGLLAALPRRGDGGAPARQQRLVDPAFRAVGIAHAAPVVVFLDD